MTKTKKDVRLMSAAQKQMQLEESRASGQCVVLTGARDWDHKRFVWMALNTVYVKRGPFTLYHGDCHLGGADQHAQEWADTNPHIKVRRFPAADYGPWPMCGPIRNRDMLVTAVHRYGRENVYGVAFPKGVSKGTRGTIELMKGHVIDHKVWEYEDAMKFLKR